MGMLLDDPHGVTKLDTYTYYETQLKNDKILLNQIDRAIAVLSASDGIQEYTIDTGQDRQTVKRAEINQLTEALYGSGRWSQVIPGTDDGEISIMDENLTTVVTEHVHHEESVNEG